MTGVNNSVATLKMAGGQAAFDISGVSAAASAYMLATSTAQTLGSVVISVKSLQNVGTYELAKGFTGVSGVSLKNKTTLGSLSFSSAKTYGGMKYALKLSSQKLTLSLSAVAGSMLKGTSSANTLTGTANCDVFYGGAGNDTLSGSNGRDVAVYDTKSWGKDTIKATSGTMTILFNGISSSQVTSSLSGTTMTISRKGVSGQSITVQGWNASTHNIVYGGTLSAFNTYVNAASPTAAQQTAARNEVWQKTGLLAG